MTSSDPCNILEYMDFKFLIDKLAKAVGLERKEFLSRVGLSEWSYYKWKDGEVPSASNLKRIEQEYGIRFVLDPDGKPLSFAFVDGTAPAHPPAPLETATPQQLHIPNSARETYEDIEFVGGKMEWLDLPDETRGYYEGLHSLLDHQIDRANDEYENALKEAKAARDAQIRKAVSEYEETFRKKMLGLLPGL